VHLFLFVHRWTAGTSNEGPAQKKAGARSSSCEYLHFLPFSSFLSLRWTDLVSVVFLRDVLCCWARRWTEGWKPGRRSRKRPNEWRSTKSLFYLNPKGSYSGRRNLIVRLSVNSLFLLHPVQSFSGLWNLSQLPLCKSPAAARRGHEATKGRRFSFFVSLS